jgi:tetratricopeptide (TPR) repeat protein
MTEGEEAKLLIEEARHLRAIGDREGCLEVFERAARADPSSSVAITECGYEHLNLLQMLEAQSAFQRGLLLEPNNKEALVGLGHVFRGLQQFDDAEQTFRHLLELDPEHAGASTGLGYTLLSRNRHEEALAAFEKAVRSNPSNTAAQFEIAQILGELGRSADAIAILREIMSSEPSKAAYHVCLARLLKQVGRVEDAREAYVSAVDLAPTNISIKVELGHLLRETDRLAEARNILEEALEQDQGHSDALNALAYVQRSSGNPEKAAELFSAVIKLQPKNVGALHTLGQIARERSDHEAALAFFETAKQQDHSNLHVRMDVAYSLQHLGRDHKAAIEFSDIVETWPDHLPAQIGLGQVLRHAGRYEEALAVFTKAEKLFETDSTAPIEVGFLLLEQRHASQAEAHFRTALVRGPENLKALLGLSYSLRDEGRMDEAEQILRNGSSSFPDNFPITLSLGQLLEGVHRLEEAVECFSKLLTKAPSNAEALTALAQVYRRVGNHNLALTLFTDAANAEPSGARKADIAMELRDLGRFAEANKILDEILAANSSEPQALMERGYTLRCQGLRSEALNVFLHVADLHPTLFQAAVEAATDYRALGQIEKAKYLLDRILSCERDHLGALLISAEIAEQSDNPEQAGAIYRRAETARPASVWPKLGRARAAFAAGEQDQAFNIIEAARTKLGPHPEFTSLEVHLLRLLRDWPRALDVLEHGLKHYCCNFWLMSHKVEIETAIGHYERAKASLNKIDGRTFGERAQVALLRGRLLEAQFQLEEARSAYCESIRLAPADPGAYLDLSRSSLLLLDLGGSKAALQTYTELTKATRILRGHSLNLSQHHQGQLLEEFFLDPHVVTRLRDVSAHTLEAQLDLLAEEIVRCSDFTATALITLIALRRSGGFGSRKREVAPRTGISIPRQIVQFSEQVPPTNMRDLMSSWNRLNPDYRWLLFDNSSAREFMRQEFGNSLLKAYDRTRYPEQKSDLFRLAFLAARGGIYVHAASRCLAPIETCMDSAATLITYQSEYGALGNDFIGATPEHPVIVRALEWGALAISRGDADFPWLSTGSGLLSRSFVHQWAGSPHNEMLQNTQVLDLGVLQRTIGLHCPVRYDASYHRRTSRRLQSAKSE